MIHPEFNLARLDHVEHSDFSHPPCPPSRWEGGMKSEKIGAVVLCTTAPIFSAFPLPRNGGGVRSENKDEAVLWHRFILVFGIIPPSHREGGWGMGEGDEPPSKDSANV